MKHEQKQIDKEKKQLLRIMKKNPDHFLSDWIDALGWVNSKNNVDKNKVFKRLKQLEAEGRILQIGHRYLVK